MKKILVLFSILVSGLFAEGISLDSKERIDGLNQIMLSQYSYNTLEFKPDETLTAGEILVFTFPLKTGVYEYSYSQQALPFYNKEVVDKSSGSELCTFKITLDGNSSSISLEDKIALNDCYFYVPVNKKDFEKDIYSFNKNKMVAKVFFKVNNFEIEDTNSSGVKSFINGKIKKIDILSEEKIVQRYLIK